MWLFVEAGILLFGLLSLLDQVQAGGNQDLHYYGDGHDHPVGYDGQVEQDAVYDGIYFHQPEVPPHYNGLENGYSVEHG